MGNKMAKKTRVLTNRQAAWEADEKRNKPHVHHKPGSQNRNK